MMGTLFKITNCDDCRFHFLVHTTEGIRHHCNYYNSLLSKYSFSAKEKPPECKVISIIVNEDL
jgi:hypothetical protein